MMQLQRILSMTVSLSLTPAVGGYDRPTSTCVVFHEPTHGSVTGASQPRNKKGATPSEALYETGVCTNWHIFETVQDMTKVATDD